MAALLTIAIACALIGLGVFSLSSWQRRHASQPGAGPETLLSDRINQILPGIHCGQCGYPGCEPYAKALARGEASIDLCPPGGEEVVQELASILGQEPVAVSQAGDSSLKASFRHKIAHIRERDCIGCTLCIKACPVDAIVGAEGHLHTVVPDRCTGCELCLAPCPTDCIDMRLPEPRLREWEWPWVHPDEEPPAPRH